eukprot:5276340-Prymnesium_polylepis.1
MSAGAHSSVRCPSLALAEVMTTVRTSRWRGQVPPFAMLNVAAAACCSIALCSRCAAAAAQRRASEQVAHLDGERAKELCPLAKRPQQQLAASRAAARRGRAPRARAPLFGACVRI